MDLVAQRSALAMAPFVASVRFAWAFIAPATLSAETLHPPSLLADVAVAAAVGREVLVVLALAGVVAGSHGAWSGDLARPLPLSLARTW